MGKLEREREGGKRKLGFCGELGFLILRNLKEDLMGVSEGCLYSVKCLEFVFGKEGGRKSGNKSTVSDRKGDCTFCYIPVWIFLSFHFILFGHFLPKKCLAKVSRIEFYFSFHSWVPRNLKIKRDTFRFF